MVDIAVGAAEPPILRIGAEIGAHVRAGQLRWREDISHGLASTPAAFAKLMAGRNQGKALVLL